mmetsp:Transcript_34462/g.89259  ORF Transcript_34462/g.89259 Transcript_34462/m.89259 type:complete len:143 (-) Transcript_34462:1992-2420(-)
MSMFATSMSKPGMESSSSKADKESEKNVPCPLNRDELGWAAWSYLHSVAAFYPAKPSEEEKETMRGFMKGVAQFYPCKICRDDFVEEMEKDPPNVDSRASLSMWVCRQHNVVNEKLGKKTFPCELSSLMARWRKSTRPECDE